MPSDPRTIESYNENAESYDRHIRDPSGSTYHSYYEKPAIRAELPSLAELDTISIGCGSGIDAQWLKDNGAKSVVGIDISTGLIDIAKSKHPEIDFFVSDMEKLDFKDESFDLAYSSLAMHYVDDWTQALTEARRVLKQGGQYVFSCGHPIDSAMEYSKNGSIREKKLGITIDDATSERTLYGDYLAADSDGTKEINGNLGDMEIVIYHRTIGKMIEQILASGFSIERLVEPLPAEELKNVRKEKYDQLRRIPFFIIWVLRK